MSGPVDLQNLINQIPFKRLAIWAALACFSYQLSDFIGIFMGVFILSFIGGSFTNSLLRNSKAVGLISKDPAVQRRALVLFYFSSIVALVTLFGVLTIPDIAREGADFVGRLQNDNIWVVLVDKMRHGLGDQIMGAIEKSVYLAGSSNIAEVAAVAQRSDVHRCKAEAGGGRWWWLRLSLDESVCMMWCPTPVSHPGIPPRCPTPVSHPGVPPRCPTPVSHSGVPPRCPTCPTPDWTTERSVALGMTVSGMLKGYTTTAAKLTVSMLSSVTRFAFEVFVSLILSFMLLWDLPGIAAGVRTLRSSRLAAIYNEIGPVLTVFAKLFGKALEAQARIALVNTVLTAAGMWALEIPGIGLLSLFVFICSFIPIAGCIISTVPIGFVALTEYGFIKLGLSILMVFAVHFVEAYALNPVIYSAHLKLHPLGVLSVLVVAEHSLGVWGLLLAVPLTVFMLDYCIRYPESSLKEVGERKLEEVSTNSGSSFDGDGLSGDSSEELDIYSSGRMHQ
ncbi:MAG: hypothetical protein WDW36_009864 [Sanguina aurantia]